MIVKPDEMDFSGRKLAMIVAGVPGIGKTTLALSAPKPLLVDLDGGVSRVEAKYRADTMVVKSFQELKEEMANEDLSAYETIVLDTGGKLFELMKPAIIAESPKNGKQDGSLSLQGYGIAKKRFSEFVNSVKAMGKNLVIVFHASEVVTDPVEKTTGLRIRIEGGTKDEIWDDMDLGGFLEMRGNKRTIGFSNCDRYYAKGTHGVHGTYELPDLSYGKPNAFLSDLFAKVNADLNEEAREAAKYRRAKEAGAKLIAEAKGAEGLNAALKAVKDGEQALTSKEELWAMMQARAKEVGARYDKAIGAFADNPIPA